MKPKPIFRIAAESLNEYAALIDADQPAPNHSPSSPRFWFDGLARELHGLRGSSWEELLTVSARQRYAAVVDLTA